MDFRTIQGGGLTHVVSTAGSGRDVVLIHGFPDTPYGWAELQDLLVASGWRVSVPWLRGYHPATTVGGRPYDAETIGRDVLALLDALETNEAILVGHDWGAAMTYTASALAPDRIRAIVTLGIPHPRLLAGHPALLWAARHFIALKMPWAPRTCRRNDFAYFDRLYRRWSPNWSGPEREETLRLAKAALSSDDTLDGAISYYRALSLGQRPDQIPVAKLPGLIVGGTADGTHEAQYEGTAELLGEGSQTLMLGDQVGHWPHRERPQEVLPAIERFLSGLDA